MRSEAKSIRSDLSRNRLAESEMSNNALDRMARQAAALALSPDEAGSPQSAAGHAVASPPAGPGSSRLGPGFAAQQGQQAVPPAAAHVELQQAQQAQQAQQLKELAREVTLTYPRSPDGAIPVEPSAASNGGQQGPPATGSLTFRPSASGSPRLDGDGAAPHAGGAQQQHAPYPPAPESDVATRGSLHSAPQHRRSGSTGSAGAVRAAHYKSLSADSTRRECGLHKAGQGGGLLSCNAASVSELGSLLPWCHTAAHACPPQQFLPCVVCHLSQAAAARCLVGPAHAPPLPLRTTCTSRPRSS